MPSYPELVGGGWRQLPFEPFRPGVTVHYLYREADDQPTVAVLNYQAGARIPRHRHQGLETIIVLHGVQSDEAGDYGVGNVVLNPAGSEHSVWTVSGCVVLIQWDRPVLILDQELQT